MQDGDVDYSRFSPRQLMIELAELSPERFPRNRANALAMLRAKWPGAPENLATVDWWQIPDERIPPERLANGATRLQVRYDERRPLERGEPWPNNLGLVGVGTATVDGERLILEQSPLRPRSSPDEAQRPAPAERTFSRDDIGNVLHRAADEAIVIGDRAGRREVTLWMQSPDDARVMLDLLPAGFSAEFAEQQARTQAFSASLRQLPRATPVTRALIAINVAVFALMLLAGAGFMTPNPQVHVAFGSNLGPLTWHGEPWRILTAAFIHFGVIHLTFNMYAFYNGGLLIERLFGSARFAVIYLLAAVAGNVASSWWEPVRNSAGASGAVFGVYGALLAFFLVRRAEIPAQTLKVVGRGAAMLCAYSLVFGAISPYVDNSAHVGGLVAGFVAGALLARPLAPQARATAQPRRVAWVALGVCLLLALMAAGIEAPRLSDPQ